MPKATEGKVQKPYLTGSAMDRRTVKRALRFLLVLVLMGIAFLLLGAVSLGSNALTYMLNTVIILLAGYLFFNAGVQEGTADVAHGEALYLRREHGAAEDPTDVATCYHPLKSLIASLLGTIPVFVLALLLALTAERQMMGIGALPAWVSGMIGKNEAAEALQFYTVTDPVSLQSVVRIPIRMLLMPLVSIVGTSNADGLLVLERLSPLLLLIPACIRGIGYMQGPKVRDRIQADIAANNKKRNRREKKQREARKAAAEAKRLN